MGMAQLEGTAVLVAGRSKSEVAREYVITLVQRYPAEGQAGLEPRSRRPLTSPLRTVAAVEDEIVEIRKQLDRDGHQAGAATIAVHLERAHGASPAVSTIWRILSAGGFVTPQPHKRPKSSYLRFEAASPTNDGSSKVIRRGSFDEGPRRAPSMADAGEWTRGMHEASNAKRVGVALISRCGIHDGRILRAAPCRIRGADPLSLADA